jgi:cytochrome c553
MSIKFIRSEIISSLLSIILCLSNLPVAAEDELFSLPGSDKKYTEKQINDVFGAPDWYPGEHPTMPKVVSHGSKPAVFACASCHLTSGRGHPESSALGGLPVDYMIRQMKAYQKFQRPGVVGLMNSIAKAMTDDEIRESAEYFAALPAYKVQDVIEADEVPATYVNSRFMRLLAKNGHDQKEAIGERLITLPVDEYRVKARDPNSFFITYVPKGTLSIGKRLVNEGKGTTAACTACHGVDLRGTAIAPLIAGQHASYLMSQLRAYKEGVRRGEADPGQIMANNVKYFTDSELLATAAYISSLDRE